MHMVRYLATAVALLAFAAGGRADTYYVVVFYAESRPQRPKYSHSWATFVHVCGCDTCGPPAPGRPASSGSRSAGCRPRSNSRRTACGPSRDAIFDLPTTFNFVLSDCENVTAFGPYQTDCWLYNKAKEHVHDLECGDTRYKTIDVGYQPLERAELSSTR